MQVELVRGPYDGMLWEIQDDTEVVILQQPPMTPAQFVAAQERPDLFEFMSMVPIQHAYAHDHTRLSQAGYQRYIYAGTKAS